MLRNAALKDHQYFLKQIMYILCKEKHCTNDALY